MNAHEERTIRALYPEGGIHAVLRALPYLRENAVRSWANRNDIWRTGGPRKNAKPPPHPTSPTRDFTSRKRSVHLRKWRGPVDTQRALVPTIGGVR